MRGEVYIARQIFRPCFKDDDINNEEILLSGKIKVADIQGILDLSGETAMLKLI